jgi:hypothetical protein
MKWIGELYDIDEHAEGDLARKTELRRTESAAVIALMKSWLWSQASLKTLSIGNAAAYVVANWDRLTRFSSWSARSISLGDLIRSAIALA